MSKIAVIGASGKTGHEIIKQALAVGHEIIALARRPEEFEIKHPKLEVRGADVFDQASLETALAGKIETVVSAIGERQISKPTVLYSETAKNTIAVMQKLQLQRFIGIASSGYIDDPQHPFWLRFLQKHLLQRIFRHVYEDTMRMEELVRKSRINWTLIRPPRLTDGRHTENYRIQKDFVSNGTKISRADLADYIVKNVNNAETYRTIFGVAY